MPTDLQMLIAFGYFVFAQDAFTAIGWSYSMSKVQVLLQENPNLDKQKKSIVSGFGISVSCVRYKMVCNY